MQVQVVLQLLGVFSDVQRDESDAAVQRVGLLRTLNQGFIQVEAKEMNFPPIWVMFLLRLLHQMLVKGNTQLLSERKERKTVTT